MARAIEQLLPDHPLIYFGDIARTPYGPKSPETIIKYSIRNTEFLLEKGAKLIIIACNSASSVATKTLRKRFQVPIIEVISPAVAKAVKISKSRRVGIIGTKATVKSNVYQHKIQKNDPSFEVFSVACPLLVPLVEEGWLDKRETKMIVRRYLHPLKDKQIDTLVLGCTHYPLLAKLIQARIGKRVQLIDSSIETALYAQKYLENHPELVSLQADASHTYYTSDSTETARQVAKRIFNRPMELILA